LYELLPDEESALTKILELVKDIEKTGRHNLKDFLDVADEYGDDSKWTISVPSHPAAVTVMTIHKSKGLDNRVVIVFLVDTKQRTDNMFFEEGEEGAQLVHITQKDIDFDEGLRKLYHERIYKNSVDSLNKLYVAFTRAKQELYIVSVKTETADEPSKFLPQTGFEPSEKPIIEKQQKPFEYKAEAYHSMVCISKEKTAFDALAFQERRRGEHIHEILSHIEYVDEHIEEKISRSLTEMKERNEILDSELYRDSLLEFLRLPEALPYFQHDEGRKILNEQEFIDSSGRLFRMDRVIVDIKNVTVIDYKTGEIKAGYRDQILNYQSILQSIYPGRSIHGILAYVDRNILQVVE
jgi:ATP-dependent exoDNAse (exonuclease V) beta subunit